MAITLTSSYQYIGRSNAVSCPNGWKYYILLYAKTSANQTTGKHTVTVKQILACTNDSTFHNWDTTGYVKVAGTAAFSWENARVPLESWGSSSSLTVGGYTYKRHTLLKEGSVEVNTAFAAKTVTLSSYWKMEDSNSAGWFPDNDTAATISEDVALSAIATASAPTLSDTTPKMGQTVTISTNRVSSALTHTLTYSFGTKTGTIDTDVGASCSWTVPDLAAYCDNALSGTLTITCKTYSGSTLVGTKSVDYPLTVQDPTVPTVDMTSATLGADSVKISTPRKSSNFTHRVTYKFGGETYLFHEAMNNYDYLTFPLSLASNIPTKQSDTCVIYCDTYNGTALVGSKNVTLTLNVPDDETTKPTFTYTLAPSPDDIVTSGFASRLSLAGKYVKNKSKLVATFDASSPYSEIASYSLRVDGVTKTATIPSITSDYIVNYYGTLSVTLRVTDARGYYTEVKDYIRVLNWVKPYIDRAGSNAGIVCERQAVNASEENTVDYDYLRIAARRVYTHMEGENVLTDTGFTQGNLCTLRYCYKKVKDDSYSDWVNLIYSGDLSTDEYVGLALDAEGNPIQLSKTDSYEVWLQIYDMTNTGTPQYFTISTDYATLHLGIGGKKAAFGKYAEIENALEIADDWDLYVHEKPMAIHVVRTWTDENNIRYRLWSDGRFDFCGSVTVTPTTANTTGADGVYFTEALIVPLDIAFQVCCFAAHPAGNYAWAINCAVNSYSAQTISFRLMRCASQIAETSYTVRLVGSGNSA